MLTLGIVAFLALAAIWGGYPLAVRILGGLRRARPASPDATAELPTVTVVIASHDSPAAIDARIDDVLRTTYPADRLELIIALDAARARSTPDQLRRDDTRIRILIGDAPGGKAPSLNAGVRAARHELLVFTDTAQQFDPAAIGELVREFRNPRIGAVSGMLELGRSGRLLNVAERYWLYERWLRHWEARLHSTVGVTGAVYAMRRALWEDLPDGLILDDLYGPMRLVLRGWRVGFTETALAHDARRFAASEEYRRKVRTLTGVIQTAVWLTGVLNPIRNPVWVQFVFHKMLRLFTPYLTIAVVLAAAWVAVKTMLASSSGVYVLGAVALLSLLALAIPRLRRVIRAQIAWTVALQSSIVVATMNGVRGRWDVWK